MTKDGAILSFSGVEGYDVYNTSVPFEYQGETYLFGRVERRNTWATSHVHLFKRVGQDAYDLVPESMSYPLEDPCIAKIGREYVLCGTHVQKSRGKIETYYTYFYRGENILSLRYFTTGPELMKDIRLVAMPDGRVGLFSRPRGAEIEAEHGTPAIVGFAIIPSLDELDAQVIKGARKVDGLFDAGEWGGANQAYMLEDGTIGVIAHRSAMTLDENGIRQKEYNNVAFQFDPVQHKLLQYERIAERADFPPAPAKMMDLERCAFPSGVLPRADGRVDLYSGLGDVCEGRIVIDAPFGLHWPKV